LERVRSHRAALCPGGSILPSFSLLPGRTPTR
jgi:hypothetical protein